MSATPESKSVLKERIGEVISARMEKTIVVRVERRMPHPKYKKIVRLQKKFYAHDEEKKAKEGDTVRIIECRPLSRLKRWKLVEVVKQAEAPLEVVT
ncbi:MAG: 30S ribosomal protein S17 [Verrucomicrobia bacterium]|jgi:small subunit ribosomal protein S17|nr:30S ribosomal protein S17 [Verrucomicrobiota bacterium]